MQPSHQDSEQESRTPTKRGIWYTAKSGPESLGEYKHYRRYYGNAIYDHADSPRPPQILKKFLNISTKRIEPCRF